MSRPRPPRDRASRWPDRAAAGVRCRVVAGVAASAAAHRRRRVGVRSSPPTDSVLRCPRDAVPVLVVAGRVVAASPGRSRCPCSSDECRRRRRRELGAEAALGSRRSGVSAARARPGRRAGRGCPSRCSMNSRQISAGIGAAGDRRAAVLVLHRLEAARGSRPRRPRCSTRCSPRTRRRRSSRSCPVLPAAKSRPELAPRCRCRSGSRSASICGLGRRPPAGAARGPPSRCSRDRPCRRWSSHLDDPDRALLAGARACPRPACRRRASVW